MPAPGVIRALRPAAGRHSGRWRVSAGYDRAGVSRLDDRPARRVGAYREHAIARMARALEEYQVLGIRTTIPFFVWLMRQAEYRGGLYDTTWLDRC